MAAQTPASLAKQQRMVSMILEDAPLKAVAAEAGCTMTYAWAIAVKAGFRIMRVTAKERGMIIGLRKRQSQKVA